MHAHVRALQNDFFSTSVESRCLRITTLPLYKRPQQQMPRVLIRIARTDFDRPHTTMKDKSICRVCFRCERMFLALRRADPFSSPDLLCSGERRVAKSNFERCPSDREGRERCPRERIFSTDHGTDATAVNVDTKQRPRGHGLAFVLLS